MTFISYAQNYEDVMLRRALKDVKKGFYIDVGANDPVIDSVTKAFYDTGWRGINIEPVTEWFNKLQEARPNDTNLKLACGISKGQNTIYDVVGTGLSTMDKSIADKHAIELDFEIKEEKIKVDSLTNICKQHANQDIHFLKIDVEGYELSVLQGLDLKTIRPWIVLVESTEPNSQVENFKEWESLLIDEDYHYCYFDGLNRYYIANEHVELDSAFMIPPNYFDYFKRANEYELEVHNQNLQKNLDADKACHDEKISELTTQFKEKIDELGHSSHYYFEVSKTLRSELNIVYSSKSWRITWPLRQLMFIARWLVHLPKRTAKKVIFLLIRLFLSKSYLKEKALNFLTKYPKFKRYMRSFSIRNGLIAGDLSIESGSSLRISTFDSLTSVKVMCAVSKSYKDKKSKGNIIFLKVEHD